MDEEWRPVVGYEGLYEVSSAGRVRAPSKLNSIGARLKERYFSICVNSNGYIHVNLRKDGVSTATTVHSLVMAAFVGERPHGFDINHIDGVKTNNRLDNLEYVTTQDNVNHAYKLGLRCATIGEKNGMAKITEKEVSEIRIEYQKGNLSQVAIGRMYGISSQMVSCIVRRENWKNV